MASIKSICALATTSVLCAVFAACGPTPGPEDVTPVYAIMADGVYVGIGYNFQDLGSGDATLEVGEGLTQEGYAWISRTLKSGDASTSKLELVKSTSDGEFVDDISLSEPTAAGTPGAVSLKAVGFPACDAASKDAAKMTLRLHSQNIIHRDLAARNMLASAPLLPQPADVVAGVEAAKQKRWMAANFKIDLRDVAAVTPVTAQSAETISLFGPATGGTAPQVQKKHIAGVKYENFRALCQPDGAGNCTGVATATFDVTYLATSGDAIFVVELTDATLLSLTGSSDNADLAIGVSAMKVVTSNTASIIWSPRSN